MEINIEQDEYIGPLTPEAGIRVDISPQGAMPFPLDKGVSLAPGYATMIGLRKVICLICNWTVCLTRELFYMNVYCKHRRNILNNTQVNDRCKIVQLR